MQRLRNGLGLVATVLLMVIMAGSAAVALAARGGMPTVLGHQALTVLSGSMAPAIRAGDVIIVRPLAPGEIVAPGDVITYRSAEQADLLVTHRVTGVVSQGGRPAAYLTRGDANAAADSATVAPEQVLGRYRWRLPLAGYLAHWLRTRTGLALGVVLPGLVLISLELRSVFRLLQAAAGARGQAGTAPAVTRGRWWGRHRSVQPHLTEPKKEGDLC